MLMDWSAMTLDDMAARFDAVLVGDPRDGETFDRILAAARGRVLRRLAWTEADRLAEIASRAVIVVDVRDAGDAADHALDRVERYRSHAHVPIIVLIDQSQIDLVGVLVGEAAQLLCEPDEAELAGALLIAGGMTSPINDTFGESEAARLQRLNEEVARIAEALSRLTARDGPSSTANDFRTSFDAGPSAVTIEPAEVRRTIRARRLRDRQFGLGLFEDPAWDMLLDLFAAELERGQVSVSSLCVAAAVAPTTALRWIGKLIDAGLFRREPDPFDRRRAFIELSPRASAGMRSYVAAVRAAGLPIA